MSPIQRQNVKNLGIILGLIVLVSVLHYDTPLHRSFQHELFSRFYYLPIFLGGLWFGLRGGFLISLFVVAVCLPHYWMIRSHNGTLFWGMFLEAIMFLVLGPLIGWLAEREHRQRIRNQELQTLAILGEAAAKLAHEIKNIIIPIRGFLRLIGGDNTLGAKSVNYLQIAECETARLEGLTRDMLQFSGQSPLRKETIRIAALVEEISLYLRQEFQSRSVDLNTEYGIAEEMVNLDRGKIRQVLINLLQNALDASPAGAQVLLRIQQDGKALKFAVLDMGDGIPAENLARVFHPFFTTKSHGTGLGLAITCKIVEQHGGKIRVESRPGKGTGVYLDLPV